MFTKLFMTIAFVLTTTSAFSQEVGVKVDKVDATAEEGTTISITKGSKKAPGAKKYTLSEGTDELVGDKDVVRKNAEINWKKACTEWKAEFKEMNKENKIVSMSCGRMNCNKDGVETTCESVAKYKVRVVAEE